MSRCLHKVAKLRDLIHLGLRYLSSWLRETIEHVEIALSWLLWLRLPEVKCVLLLMLWGATDVKVCKHAIERLLLRGCWLHEIEGILRL